MHENISITYEDFAELAKSASDVTYQDDPHRIDAGIKRMKKNFRQTALVRELEPIEQDILEMCLDEGLWSPAFMWLAIEES